MDIRTKLHISSLKDIVLTVIGAVLCGLGCGFENFASLGMDAVGTFFDGVRTALKLPLDSRISLRLEVGVECLVLALEPFPLLPQGLFLALHFLLLHLGFALRS